MRRALQISLPLVILAVGFLGAYWLLSNRKKVTPEPTELFKPVVEVVTVKSEVYIPLINSQGRVAPGRTINFNPEISGKISSVAPSLVSGTLVEKGQKLYQIDDRDYRIALIKADSETIAAQAAITNAFAQIASSKARVVQAVAALSGEEAEALAARKEWELLGKVGMPPDLLVRKPQIREAEAALTAAKAMVEAAIVGSSSAKASLTAANAAKEQVILNISRCTVKAPFDSRIDVVDVDVGSYVTPSMSTLVLQRIDYCEIMVPLSAEEFGFLGVNSTGASESILRSLGRATLISDHHNWNGYLTRINGDIDPLTQTIGVVVRVDQPYTAPPAPLRFGLFVKAVIRGVPIKKVVRLPETALRVGGCIYIHGQGKLYSSKVEVIRREQGYIYVRGVPDGVQACITQLDSFEENMPVILTREKQ